MAAGYKRLGGIITTNQMRQSLYKVEGAGVDSAVVEKIYFYNTAALSPFTLSHLPSGGLVELTLKRWLTIVLLDTQEFGTITMNLNDELFINFPTVSADNAGLQISVYGHDI